MKKISTIILLLLLATPVSAGEVTRLPDDTTVNDLLEQGYRLVLTDSVGYSVPSGDGYANSNQGVFYHLIKGKELVTCILSQLQVLCVRP
tara:strand:- start:522 stop:791 length:270 start_codon:yes stop_codon:yes gene_type:complete